jgi:hypothetical protein
MAWPTRPLRCLTCQILQRGKRRIPAGNGRKVFVPVPVVFPKPAVEFLFRRRARHAGQLGVMDLSARPEMARFAQPL